MSAAPRRDDPPGILSDMEMDVRDLTRWAETVCQLGSSDYDPRDCLLVVGPAMREVAERVEANWERALNLSRGQRGGDR